MALAAVALLPQFVAPSSAVAATTSCGPFVNNYAGTETAYNGIVRGAKATIENWYPALCGSNSMSNAWVMVASLLRVSQVLGDGASATDDPTSTAVDATVTSTMPAAVRNRVLAQHLVVVPASKSEVAAQRIDAADALRAARKAFGLDEGARALSATLMHLTTPKMGIELQGADSGPSQLQPEYSDKLVWLVALDGVRDFYAGPRQPAGVQVPTVQIGVMVAAVDASTNKALFSFIS